jgi:cell division protein FtsA
VQVLEPLCALDIGTNKICALIADVNEPDGVPRVLGVGQAPAEGLRRGVVVDLEKTVRSIAQSITDAELMAQVKIDRVICGIGGDQVKSINSRGVVAIPPGHHEVNQADVDRALAAARAVLLPADREIIHCLPVAFTMDDQPGIKDPIGMTGRRLEVEVHIVTGAVNTAQNITRALELAGLGVADLVLQPVASGWAVLDDEERDIGTLVIDIGGQTTDIAVFLEGSIRHTACIGVGGRNVTNDLAIGLRIGAEVAEELKRMYGSCIAANVPSDEICTIPGTPGRPPRDVERSFLAEVIEPRMEEIFSLCKREFDVSPYRSSINGGCVITGGAVQIEGACELAEKVLGMPVKLGYPRGVGGLTDLIASPIFATAVGLIRQAAFEPAVRRERGPMWQRMRSRLGEILREYI